MERVEGHNSRATPEQLQSIESVRGRKFFLVFWGDKMRPLDALEDACGRQQLMHARQFPANKLEGRDPDVAVGGPKSS
jgi:thymidine kinase